jgi:YVTN family beta-propeller protein
MKSVKFSLYIAAFGLLMLFNACSSDDAVAPAQVGAEGFYVVNEGLFNAGNASISYFDRSTGTVTNDLFATANGIPLGDQAQSMYVRGNLGFIVVQGSKKVEVVNLDDFTSVATITDGIESPRYFVAISDSKGYLSDWGDGFAGTVKVIDLTNYTVTASIATGSGPNRMLLRDGMLYVTHNGGFGRDNTIKVIDTNTDMVTKTFETADNPNSIQFDSDGNIWVACSGFASYPPPDYQFDEATSEPGALIKMDTDGNELVRLELPVAGQGAKGLTINTDGTTLYYIDGSYQGDIYSLNHDATTLPATPMFSGGLYYGVAFDQVSGSVIACEAPNFTSSGNIQMGADSYTVGIGPNGCVFR